MKFQAPKKFIAALLLVTSFTHLTAYGAAQVEIESESEASAESSVSESAQNSTLQDAKGNRIRLLTAEAAAALEAKKPDLWSHLDLDYNGVPGTSTAMAYRRMNLRAPAEPIIVAVLDSGVDTTHPDLAGMIWENPAEKNGRPGVDDDGDGYIDDVNGWNFLGGPDGQNVGRATLELTRELKRMRALNSGPNASVVMTPDARAYLGKLEREYSKNKKRAEAKLEEYTSTRREYLDALALLKKSGLKSETLKAVKSFKPKNSKQRYAKAVVLAQINGEMPRDSKVLGELVEHYTATLNYNLNLNFESSTIVKDNPKNLRERFYGNGDVRGGGGSHGTHCAGIIGALRKNGVGPDGQSNFVKIMAVRAVPEDGDERDKDIANGIRFAVDHGARIISMSFGKSYSPNKRFVDEAIAYATAKNVLFVHAAGNDGKDLEKSRTYPSTKLLTGRTSENWIEVGASTRNADFSLPADFSNYGQKSVDLFAPGQDIYSTTPNGTYAVYSGTSMATPEVAGVAALVLSQRPELSAAELKKILTTTVTTFPSLTVIQPSQDLQEALVPFSSLSATGGIVNAYRALESVGF